MKTPLLYHIKVWMPGSARAELYAGGGAVARNRLRASVYQDAARAIAVAESIMQENPGVRAAPFAVYARAPKAQRDEAAVRRRATVAERKAAADAAARDVIDRHVPPMPKRERDEAIRGLLGAWSRGGAAAVQASDPWGIDAQDVAMIARELRKLEQAPTRNPARSRRRPATRRGR